LHFTLPSFVAGPATEANVRQQLESHPFEAAKARAFEGRRGDRMKELTSA